jgi:hypothetical protein
MAKANEDWISADEAVAHIMRVTGKTRRQATAALLEKLRAGKIRAMGSPVDPRKERKSD